MKLTKSTLRRIIKEEINNMLNERDRRVAPPDPRPDQQELEAGDYGEDFAIMRDYLDDLSSEISRSLKEIYTRLNDLDGKGI